MIGDMEWRRSVALTGLLLGYPMCCIIAFTKLQHIDAPPRKLHGTGFVPCTRCNERVSEQALIKFISVHHIIKTPFNTNFAKVWDELDAICSMNASQRSDEG